MKTLSTIALTSLLLLSCGCQATPVETTTVSTPVEQAPVKTKFVVDDRVTVTSPDGETTVTGTIVDVGPIAEWLNPVTEEVTKSRAYRVKVIVNGQDQIGVAPEFALSKPTKK